MVSSGMLRRVALVRTDVSEELSASFIRVTRIGELGTTLAVTSSRRFLRSVRQLLVTASVVLISVSFCACLSFFITPSYPQSTPSLHHVTSVILPLHIAKKREREKTPWPLVRKRTTPTERPPFIDEI
jgi:hypothetical protein